MRPAHGDWGGAALGALAIVAGSAALGLLVNHFSPRGIPLLPRGPEVRLPLPAGLEALSLKQTKAIVEAKSALVLDARAPDRYAAGHLPGARNLPVEGFEEAFLGVADQLEAAPQVLVYCESADCAEAIELADRLREAFPGKAPKLLLFAGGWSEWSAARYPAVRGDAP